MPDNESNTPRTESSNAPSVIDTISDIGTVNPQDDDLLIIRRGDAKGLFYFDADRVGVADEIDVLDGPDSVGRWLRIIDRPSLDGARDVLLASGVTDADEIYFLLTNSQGDPSTNEKMSGAELAKATDTINNSISYQGLLLDGDTIDFDTNGRRLSYDINDDADVTLTSSMDGDHSLILRYTEGLKFDSNNDIVTTGTGGPNFNWNDPWTLMAWINTTDHTSDTGSL